MLARLLELAVQVGLKVRTDPGVNSDGERPPSSGLVKLRGEWWLVLVASDPLEERIDLAVRALRTHAAEFLESHYLPPALRARLEPDDPAP